MGQCVGPQSHRCFGGGSLLVNDLWVCPSMVPNLDQNFLKFSPNLFKLDLEIHSGTHFGTLVGTQKSVQNLFKISRFQWCLLKREPRFGKDFFELFWVHLRSSEVNLKKIRGKFETNLVICSSNG